MRSVAKPWHFLGVMLMAVVVTGCTASRIDIVPEASRLRVGSQPPSGDYEQLGALTAKHGAGCGIYGTRGNYEGAFTLLRNKAAELGADYVQILKVTEPRLEGICMNQAFVLDGMAYKIGRRPPTSQAHVGLNGTYTGDITGTSGGLTFALRMTFTLVQTGDQIVGTWNTSGGMSGTMTAKVVEHQMVDFRAKQINPCEADFHGAAVIDGDGARLRGTYVGSGCDATISASFVVARQ